MGKMMYLERRENTCGGKLLIKGTRFSIAQLVCELADGYSLQDVCDDFELDYELCQNALRESSNLLL